MLENIESLVDFAYENVSLYGKLYGKKPEIKTIEDFWRLPYVTRGDFALCGIEDIISDPDEATIILPPIENRTIFPFPRMESALDRDNRYRIFYFLLEKSGISEESSFLIITDTAHSYYCGEIANNLLYYGHPTWMMVLRDHSDDEIRSWIGKFEPDCLFLGLNDIPDVILEAGIENVFTINHCKSIYGNDLMYSNYSSPPFTPLNAEPQRRVPSLLKGEIGKDVSHFDIYAVTELGWVGIKIPGGHYAYPEEFFYMESDPISGNIVITALDNWLQPFVRYKTQDRGIVLGENSLNITYIGEH